MILIAAAALALHGAPDPATPMSATRYIDAQGVEVIHNRGVPAPARALPPAGTQVLPEDNPRLRVSAGEQRARDQDRVAILEQELVAESRKYESAWKRLHDAGRAANPDASDAMRTKEELNDHQKNIQALNAELRRTRGTR